MPSRNFDMVRQALEDLNPVERNINELQYYQKYLNHPNHSEDLCASVQRTIEDLDSLHGQLVYALEVYGNRYQETDAQLARANHPDASENVETGETFAYVSAPEHQKGFWEKTWNQIVLGDFSDDVTWLGSVASIALAFTAADAPMDFRDMLGSAQKGEWGWAVVNGISLLPVVGVVGEIGSIAKKTGKAAKALDNTAEAAQTGKQILKNVDNMGQAGEQVAKSLDDVGQAGEQVAKSLDDVWQTGEQVAKQGDEASDLSKAGKSADDVAETATKQLKYDINKLKEHCEPSELKYSTSGKPRGNLDGAHNQQYFKNFSEEAGAINVKNITEEKTYLELGVDEEYLKQFKESGFSVYEYQLPRRGKGGILPPIEQRTYKDGFSKTVYNPDIISTDDYIKRGLEAANDALSHGGIYGHRWEGLDSQGIKWVGYFDDKWEMSTLFPTLKWPQRR